MTAAGWTAEEVRLAMAWNGGVSLAIWMGGAAVELDTARRAHLGPQTEEGNERSLYYELTQAFRRELVIDILAGASAGGINGALLSAAIARRRELRPAFLRDRWLELGDLSSLLRPVNEEAPISLMRGDYFQTQLRKAFRAVTGENGGDDDWLQATEPSQPELAAGDVVLDVQATNVLGAQRGFSDKWRQTLYAREYRAPIRFRQPDDFTSDALAAAGRASASFPAAFEPFALINKSARLGGFPGVKRWAIDGGLLENAPIRPAIELIATRAAERPVTRFVCYVNAAPSMFEEDEDDPLQPVLGKVLADVVNLPREGRFIEQLIAIEDAAQRTLGAGYVTAGLLRMPRDPLLETAEAMLTSYRRTRTTSSLRELLTTAAPDAGEVAAMIAAVEKALDGRPLPWIPDSLAPPTQASEWRWGLRAAQRVLLLQLDLLHEAAEHDDPLEADRLSEAFLEYRRPINTALARLEDARQRFAGSPAIRRAARELAVAAEAANDDDAFERKLSELDSLLVGFRCEAYDAVNRGLRALHTALDSKESFRKLAEPLLAGKASQGRPGDPFLERALSIEVIRRASAPERDLEPTQPLHFVQLTPLAPARVFTSTPLHDEGPNSGREKLTGLDLLHFSAFYRGSWRANDFMWGRLDAATRIVDLLVSPLRICRIAEDEKEEGGANPLIQRLAEQLVPSGDDASSQERRQLVKEALDDARLEWRWRSKDATLSDDEQKLVRGHPAAELLDSVARIAAEADEPKDAAELRELLRQALEADLAEPEEGGFFTRVVCARAAQYEILLQELEPLAKATADDGRLGCFTKPITYDGAHGALLRARSVVTGETLPTRLGSRVPEEVTSTLAVRTLSHAVIVLLSTLKTAGIPMGGLFGFLRAPFLSLAGITAASVRYRATALLVFISASFYLTARAIGAEKADVKLGLIWSSSTLAAAMAALGVLGLVLLPLWRASRARRWGRRAREGTWGAALFLVSGLAATVAAVFSVGLGNAITSTNGFSLPRSLALAVILVPLGGTYVIRHFRLPLLGRKRFAKLTSRVGVTALATVAVAGWLIWESYPTLRDQLSPGELVAGFSVSNLLDLVDLVGSPSELWDSCRAHWRDAAVVAAYASIPVAGAYGLKGFVRRAYDVARFRALGPLGRSFHWAGNKLDNG